MSDPLQRSIDADAEWVTEADIIIIRAAQAGELKITGFRRSTFCDKKPGAETICRVAKNWFAHHQSRKEQACAQQLHAWSTVPGGNEPGVKTSQNFCPVIAIGPWWRSP